MRHSTHGRLHSEAPKTTPHANHTSLSSSPLASTSVTKNVTSLHYHIACTIRRVVCNIQHDTKVRLYTLCSTTIAHHSAHYTAHFGLASPCGRKQSIMLPAAYLLPAPILCIPSLEGMHQQRLNSAQVLPAVLGQCANHVPHAPSHRPGPHIHNSLQKLVATAQTPKSHCVHSPPT